MGACSSKQVVKDVGLFLSSAVFDDVQKCIQKGDFTTAFSLVLKLWSSYEQLSVDEQRHLDSLMKNLNTPENKE